MQVPLLDLKAQFAEIKDEVLAAVSEVVQSQQCIGGPKVTELEEKTAALSNCKYAVGASSGTDALLNSLMSLDIGYGDEVITTAFTFFAPAGCIARTGAKPVFVDIDAGTYNINPQLIEAAVTEKTKAILPVHLYGQMAEMDPIMRLAEKYNLAVIEDAAQAIGSKYKGKKACSYGNAGCLSFYPTKNLGGIGDGGMIATNDKALAEKMKIMRDHGQNPTYYYDFVGGNFRLDPIQAAALLVKMKYLDQWANKRKSHAAYYDEKFKDSPITIPYIHPDCDSVYNQYVIRVSQREKIIEHLRNNSVGCGVYYPLCLHEQKCFEYLGYKQGDFPEAETASKEVLAIPVYPELTDEMKNYVTETILSFYK